MKPKEPSGKPMGFCKSRWLAQRYFRLFTTEQRTLEATGPTNTPRRCLSVPGTCRALIQDRKRWLWTWCSTTGYRKNELPVALANLREFLNMDKQDKQDEQDEKLQSCISCPSMFIVPKKRTSSSQSAAIPAYLQFWQWQNRQVPARRHRHMVPFLFFKPFRDIPEVPVICQSPVSPRYRQARCASEGIIGISKI